MNAITKLEAALFVAGAMFLCSTGAYAWWDDDDDYDRWYRGPWYGGHPGYGYYGGGYPGYPGYDGWGGYPYRMGETIIVLPQDSSQSHEASQADLPVPE